MAPYNPPRPRKPRERHRDNAAGQLRADLRRVADRSPVPFVRRAIHALAATLPDWCPSQGIARARALQALADELLDLDPATSVRLMGLMADEAELGVADETLPELYEPSRVLR